MRLIYLHGPPASGKYTIAKALESVRGLRNFHNHLTLDVSKALFEFGSEQFWALTHELRLTSLRAIAGDDEAVVVFTNCYSHPEDAATVSAIQDLVERAGGGFLPVFLDCAVSELERRVSDPSRINMKKLHTVEGLEQFLTQWNCIALPHADCITIQTSERTPEDCADEIVKRLSLRADLP